MQSLTPNLDERLRADPAAVRRARDLVVGFAAAAGAGEAELDAVRLAVSEAVTNAVLHGYRGEAGEIDITAAVGPRGALHVCIRDRGCGMRRPADRPGMGFGLGLIAEFTEEMTVVRHTRGTELRMRFALAGARKSASAAPSAPSPRQRSAAGYSAAAAAS